MKIFGSEVCFMYEVLFEHPEYGVYAAFGSVVSTNGDTDGDEGLADICDALVAKYDPYHIYFAHEIKLSIPCCGSLMVFTYTDNEEADKWVRKGV